MKTEILRAGFADLETILQLQKECYLEEAAIYGDFNIRPLLQDLGSIREEFAGSFFLKATECGRIVGSVRAFEKGNTCFIGRLIVVHDFQNQGVGTLLLESIEKHFPQCRRFELFTGFKSQKNLYLYQKLGYVEFDKKQVNEKLDLIFLEKFCTGPEKPFNT